jgi:plastocyanin
MRILSISLVTILAAMPILPPESKAESVVEVKIQKYKYIPSELTISVGQKVRWLNTEKRQYHSVWFEAEESDEPDYFFPEETFERTFDKPGVYNYRCGPHPEMKGKIIVK